MVTSSICIDLSAIIFFKLPWFQLKINSFAGTSMMPRSVFDSVRLSFDLDLTIVGRICRDSM